MNKDTTKIDGERKEENSKSRKFLIFLDHIIDLENPETIKNVFKVLIIIAVIVLIIPILLFFIFEDSDKTFGNFMEGFLTPIIALIGIMVTLSVNYISQRNIEKQRMLQRPLIFLRRIDYKTNIELVLQNKGLGPAIITSMSIKGFKADVKNGIYDIIKDIDLECNTYTGDQTGLVLASNEEKVLFQITDTCANFENKKQKIRAQLSKLRFVIRYQDIYGKDMEEYKCSLDWYSHTPLKTKNLMELKKEEREKYMQD